MDEKNLTFYQYYPDKNIKDYVYYRSLLLNNPTLWGEVGGVLQQSLRLFSGKLKQQSLKNLKDLYMSERNKEIDFLQKAGFTLKNSQNWDELVKGFNIIYKNKEIFYRNVELIQKIGTENKDGTINNQGRIDIISNYQTYLKNAAFNFIQNDYENFEQISVQDFAYKIVKDAWELMYSASDSIESLKDEEKNIDGKIQAYSEMLEIFKQLDYNNSVFDEIIKEIGMDNFTTFFGKLKEFKQGIKKVKKSNLPNFKVAAKGVPGNLLEIVATTFINNIEGMEGTIIRTGNLKNPKADHMQLLNCAIGVTISDIQDLLSTSVDIEGTNRIKNIERVKKMFDVVTQGDIVFISDKNYDLTAKSFIKNKGFSAQTKVTLSNLKDFFSYLNTGAGREENIEDLIFVMANTGDKNFLNQDKTTIQRYLATKIAYFLFDDVTIAENLIPPDINAIHIFNLDNIYIPFSVFLEAAYSALNNIDPDDYRRFVNVNFVSEPYQYKDQTDGLEKLDWIIERQRREEKSYIKYYFFGDFVNFIKQYINLIS